MSDQWRERGRLERENMDLKMRVKRLEELAWAVVNLDEGHGAAVDRLRKALLSRRGS